MTILKSLINFVSVYLALGRGLVTDVILAKPTVSSHRNSYKDEFDCQMDRKQQNIQYTRYKQSS